MIFSFVFLVIFFYHSTNKFFEFKDFFFIPLIILSKQSKFQRRKKSWKRFFMYFTYLGLNWWSYLVLWLGRLSTWLLTKFLPTLLLRQRKCKSDEIRPCLLHLFVYFKSGHCLEVVRYMDIKVCKWVSHHSVMSYMDTIYASSDWINDIKHQNKSTEINNSIF